MRHQQAIVHIFSPVANQNGEIICAGCQNSLFKRMSPHSFGGPSLPSVLDNFRSIHRFLVLSRGRCQPNKFMYKHEHPKETNDQISLGNGKAQLKLEELCKQLRALIHQGCGNIVVGCKAPYVRVRQCFGPTGYGCSNILISYMPKHSCRENM